MGKSTQSGHTGPILAIPPTRKNATPVLSEPHTPGTPQWETRYSRKLIWTDIAVVVLSLISGTIVASQMRTAAQGPQDAHWHLSIAASSVLIGLAWLIGLSLSHSRRPSVFGTGPNEYNRVSNATIMAFGLMTLLFFMLGIPPQRSFLITALPLGLVLLLIGRLAWRKRLHRQRRRKLNTYRTLLIGERRKSTHTAKQLQANTLAGFSIVGAVTAESGARELLPGVPIVADYSGILVTVENLKIDTLIITSSDSMTPQWLRRLSWELEARNIDIIMASALTDIAGPRIHTRPVAGLPLIHVEYPQFHGWRYFTKRLLDLGGASLAILITSPLLIALALAVRIDSHGPIIFKQPRIGRQGKTFTMYKFRSMRADAENDLPGLLDRSDGDGMLFKLRDDPRVTPLGKFIRKHSLDELPQLFNVVKGDMSLVGPRPPLQREAEKYEDWVNRRLFVRPGISGLWQVSGRSNLTWDESVRLDLYYVENWSLMGDLLILWRTIRTVIRGDGAY